MRYLIPLLCLFICACETDDDVSPTEEPTVVICQPPASTPAADRLPKNITVTNRSGETTRAVTATYDEAGRLSTKTVEGGSGARYVYNNASNPIPDTVFRTDVAFPEAYVYTFSESCQPILERYLLLASQTVIIGATDYTYDGDVLIESEGMLNIASDELTYRYFKDPATGLLDSIIGTGEARTTASIASIEYYFTYTDIDNPRVVPLTMSYESLARRDMELSSKMPRTVIRHINRGFDNLSKVSDTCQYRYTLDASGRLATAEEERSGRRVVYEY